MKLTDLNGVQLANAKVINQALVDIGLTNPFLRAGILAVVGKESGFELKHEISYANTPAKRIIQIFGADRFKGFDIDVLKKSDKSFFDLVYNRKDLGNGPLEGYKYRGRGFNQLTGKANYFIVGKGIGVDIVTNPDLMDTVEIAAKALAYYFRSTIVAAQFNTIFFRRYGIITTSQIKDILQGARIAHNANMGFKYPPEADPTGGYQITIDSAPSFLPLTQN